MEVNIHDDEEISLLRMVLRNAVFVSSMSIKEIEALNRLRLKVGLPVIPGVDDLYIQKYCNCFRGCEG